MPQIAYTVTATFPDPATADEFCTWLRAGHVAAVIAGGGHAATIVRLDPEPPATGRPQVEVRYLFPSREVLDRYLRDHAPALGAEGLERFGPDRGVTFARRTGTVE